MIPKSVERAIDEVGLEYESYSGLRFGEFDFDWVVVISIRGKGDIEKYGILWDRLGDSLDSLRNGLITFRVV